MAEDRPFDRFDFCGLLGESDLHKEQPCPDCDLCRAIDAIEALLAERRLLRAFLNNHTVEGFGDMPTSKLVNVVATGKAWDKVGAQLELQRRKILGQIVERGRDE